MLQKTELDTLNNAAKDFETIKDSFQKMLDTANQEYDAMSEEQQEEKRSTHFPVKQNGASVWSAP